jgi:hypothetical protein
MSIQKLKIQLAKTRRELADARRTILKLARENMHWRVLGKPNMDELMTPYRDKKIRKRRQN